MLLINAALDETVLALDKETPFTSFSISSKADSRFFQVKKRHRLHLIHSDRGAHYRLPGWIERIETFGLTRSMFKKTSASPNSMRLILTGLR